MSLGQAVVPNSHPLWYVLYIPLDTAKGTLAIQIDATESIESGVQQSSAREYARFFLYQNYPNLFNPTTCIPFSLHQPTMVQLTVFNILGQAICSLISRRMSAGSFVTEWDATSQPSGSYIQRLEAGNADQSGRMILLK